LTNNPHPVKIDGIPPEVERILLASLFDIQGVLSNAVVSVTTTEQIFYYINDHLGTPQKMLDEEGQIVWQASYMSFGEAELAIYQKENHLRFPGQYYDFESGFHYNYHRYYDHITGRYLSADPIGLIGGINQYAYTMNNPVNLMDYFGLMDRRYHDRPVLDPGPNSSGGGLINLPIIDPAKNKIEQFRDAMEIYSNMGESSKVGQDMLEWYNSRQVEKKKSICPEKRSINKIEELRRLLYEETELWPGVIE